MEEAEEEIDFGLQDSEGEDEGEEVVHKKIPKKVYIEINDKDMDGQPHTFTCTDERLGKPYTSVGFSANSYGSGCPCETEEEIKEHIKQAKEWIIKEGDIPIIRDLRERCKLSRWCS